MNTLLDGTGVTPAIPTAVLELLGSVFLHSLWQATAVAGGLAAILACLPRTTAAVLRLRYLACVTALVAVPLFAVMAVAWPVPALDWAAGSLHGGTTLVGWLAPWVAACGLAWATGIGFGMLRLAVGWSLSRRLVGAATRDQRLERQVDRWRTALGICGRVRVRVSAAVTVPVLVGVARPVILWPTAIFTGFAPEHIEAILVHELAHVRRHDALVNLLQVVIETTFFHHPAVWWISAQVRGEREHCADELAVAVLGQSAAAARLRYATALVMLEERQRGRPTLAIASDGGCLVARIRRLAGATERIPSTRPLVAAASIALLAATFGLTTGVTARPAAEPMAARHPQAGGGMAATPSGPGSLGPRVLEESTSASAGSASRNVDAETVPAARRLPAAAAAVAWPSLVSDDLRSSAAAVLAAVPRLSPGVVPLTRLTSLSATVAAIVGRMRAGELEIGGGRAVTPREVCAVAQQRWRRVSIGSLTTLCPEMAAALATLSCVEIELAGVRTLSAEAAVALARFRGRRICLDGIESLPCAAARGLAAFGARAADNGWRGGMEEIRLGGLQTLDAELVDAFAAFGGTLLLPGVTAIDGPTSEAIARLPCAVSLPNLQHAAPAARVPHSGRLPVLIPIGGVLATPSDLATAFFRTAHLPGGLPGS